MSSIQQLESQLADAEDQVQSIRQQLREHYLEKAAQYDSPRLQPGTPGNGKPPVNTTGKKRKAKPAKPAAPRKPRIDPNDADRAVIAELSQQDGVGQQAIADVCKLTYQQAGAALKRLVKAGRVSQEGKRPAKYLLQVAPSTDTATDNDSIIPLAEHIISTGDHAPARTVARLLSVLLQWGRRR